MTTDPWCFGIVIPARDESAGIARCVHAVRMALDAAEAKGWIVVVADRCEDDTASRALAAVGEQGEVIVTHRGMVGAARRTGCERLAQRFRAVPSERLWLMSTDADSTVPCDWIEVHRAEADAGAAAVAGTVRVGSFVGRSPRLRSRYEHLYALRSGEPPHLHGTNFGVRADAYAAVGGWEARATGEEHDLWQRLIAAGFVTVSTTQAPVVTSARRRGRAPRGFAAYLNALELAEHVPS